MHGQKRTRLRWDRIFMVLGGIVVASLGIAAMVPGGEGFEDGASEGRVAMSVQPMTTPAPEPIQPAIQEEALETPATVEVPTQSRWLGCRSRRWRRRRRALPRRALRCSCSKRTMKLARNPYTDHQKRARTLPAASL